MKHVAVDVFWDHYKALPLALQKLADNNFSIIKQYPNHPLLRLLKIDEYISMRIGSRHRAIGIQQQETIIWFWIGTQKQYNTLVD
ncbi:MAG: hypothetical protein HYV29_10140 [Ignavibacteriales bacterium]|nr:hypothetical protein [Ignavibacteriales bacterium]